MSDELLCSQNAAKNKRQWIGLTFLVCAGYKTVNNGWTVFLCQLAVMLNCLMLHERSWSWSWKKKVQTWSWKSLALMFLILDLTKILSPTCTKNRSVCVIFQQDSLPSSLSAASAATASAAARVRPFSNQEDRRLECAVSIFGEEWPRILSTYSFGGRTADQLSYRWRQLCSRPAS